MGKGGWWVLNATDLGGQGDPKDTSLQHSNWANWTGYAMLTPSYLKPWRRLYVQHRGARTAARLRTRGCPARDARACNCLAGSTPQSPGARRRGALAACPPTLAPAAA